MNAQGRDRGAWLAAAGAACGLALAVAHLVALPEPTAENVVAVVNGVEIHGEALARAAAAVAGGRVPEAGTIDTAFLLDRLIDEELLVQRGIELGLASFDPALRKSLVAAVVEAATAEARSHEPSEEEVRAYFDANRTRFATEPRLHVQRYRFASQAAAQTARESITSGRIPMDARDPVLPDSALPPSKLREYIGPTATAALAALAPGEASPILSRAGRHDILVLQARYAGEPPDFDRLHDAVADELRRARADLALRGYLEELRARAEVVVRVARR